MLLQIGVADFCVEPTDNLIPLLPPGEVSNITSYYSTCVGTNPFEAYLTSAENAADEGVAAIDALLIVCPNNQYVQSAADQAAMIQPVFDIIANLTECSPTQEQVLSVLNDGVCDEYFNGFFRIWLSQYISAACLLLCTIFMSLLYKYFIVAIPSEFSASTGHHGGVSYDGGTAVSGTSIEFSCKMIQI